MKVTVLVPTYRRPDDLARCLSALLRQQRTPEQIVVVARADDEATHACLAEHVTPRLLNVEVATVAEPGQVAALNRGLEAATGDLEGLGALEPAKPDNAEVDYEVNLEIATAALNDALDQLREVRDGEQANN